MPVNARIVAISASDGKQLTMCDLDVRPAFDGMIAVKGRLLIALADGSLVCLTGRAR